MHATHTILHRSAAKDVHEFWVTYYVPAHTERERDRETERQRQRDRDRQRQTETETERQRDRNRQRETQTVTHVFSIDFHWRSPTLHKTLL